MKVLLLNIFATGLLLSQFISTVSCNKNRSSTIENNQVEVGDSLYHFDIHTKSVAQPFDAIATPAKYKFVEVEITKVVNPQKLPVIFEVNYEATNSEKTLLGSFSLYPADNPGKFIVPTQGKLNRSGVIILSLLIPEGVVSSNAFNVTTKKIKLIKE